LGSEERIVHLPETSRALLRYARGRDVSLLGLRVQCSDRKVPKDISDLARAHVFFYKHRKGLIKVATAERTQEIAVFFDDHRGLRVTQERVAFRGQTRADTIILLVRFAHRRHQGHQHA